MNFDHKIHDSPDDGGSNLCYICNEYMGPFRNEFSVCTGFSERPIFQIFESISKLKLSDEAIFHSGICQNCYLKFHELDEHQSIALRIQNDIMLIYERTLEVETKPQIKAEIDTDDFVMVEVVPNDGTISDNSENYDKLSSSKKLNVSRGHKRKRKNLDEGLLVLEVDGAKVYQCEICKKLCKDRYKLKTHREIHTTERTVCCNECGAMFKTLTCLYSHKKIHRERIYHSCDHCDMRYIQKTQLRKHMDAIHLKKKDHVCSICGKCYSRDTTLSKHMFVHKEEKEIVCKVCGFGTHTKPKMERHMKSHTGERNYSCHICGKKFLYSYNVTAHIKHVHYKEKRKIDEEKLTCKFCGKRFQKIWKVKRHLSEVHQLVEGVEVDDG